METRLQDIQPAQALSELLSRRAALDEIDRSILELVSQRTALAGEIGVLKASLGIELRDRERESIVISQGLRRARKLGLPSDVVFKLMECLLEAARRRQRTRVSGDL